MNLKRLVLGLGVMVLAITAPAQSHRTVSEIDDPALISISANGDSVLPVVSLDGRYVLFASSADNLCALGGTNGIPPQIPAKVNVYIQDRQAHTTELVSVNLAGTGGGNGNSWPVAISTNGHQVLFESTASDLVAGDTNNANDIFLRDLSVGSTLLISVSTNGASGSLGSRSADMTPDAQLVVFVSEANNLVSKDTNGLPDIFVRDIARGTTVMASPGARSTGAASTPTGSSEAPEISADGRYVAFYSTATNLVPGVRTTGELYIRDLAAGTTLFASAGARAAMYSITGVSNNVVSFNQALSADGRFLAYEAATNRGIILRFDSTTGTTDIVATNAAVPTASPENVHNLSITADGRFVAYVASSNYSSVITTSVRLWDAQSVNSTLVSGDTNNLVPSGTSCDSPTVDETGRYVVFVSSADLTGNLQPGVHVYQRDTQLGVTTLLDAGPGGAPSRGVSFATAPRCSSDGGIVVFESMSTDLVDSDRNRAFDVFLRDTRNQSVELVSSAAPGLLSLTPNGISSLTPSSLSASGQYVAFSTEADNLLRSDTNLCRDVFVRDMVAGTNILVSVSTNGVGTGNGISSDGSITADGRYVAFASFANDLVAADTNRFMDIFVRDLQTGSTELVSINNDASQSGNGDSYSPVISADGRYVLFRSRARNLAAGISSSGYENLFVRDLQGRTNYAVTTAGVLSSASTPDGRFVAFTTGAAGSVGGPLYVWDAQSATRVFTNSASVVAVAISPDGQRVAYWIGTTTRTLYVGNVATGTAVAVGTSTLAPPAQSVQFSGDGRLLACLMAPAGVQQAYLYDIQSPSLTLVSKSFDGAGAGNAGANSVAMSPDGRFLAYRSSASNLVPVDTNGVPDLFLYDTLTGSTTLLSLSSTGASTAGNRSLRPVFSADSRTVFFQSWAPDLVAGDANQSSDIFGYTLYSSGIIPLFSAQIFSGGAGGGAVVTWAVVPGKAYSVQYKDNLDDPDWKSAGQGVLIGNQGWFQDGSGAPHRFFRVVAF